GSEPDRGLRASHPRRHRRGGRGGHGEDRRRRVVRGRRGRGLDRSQRRRQRRRSRVRPRRPVRRRVPRRRRHRRDLRARRAGGVDVRLPRPPGLRSHRPRAAERRRTARAAPRAGQDRGTRGVADGQVPRGRRARQRGVRDMGGRSPADGAAAGHRPPDADAGPAGAGDDRSVAHQRPLPATGRGPGDPRRLPADTAYTRVVRTIHHPAAAQLAERRQVIACDALYESSDGFDDVYEAIAERVAGHAADGPTIYAVPGSPMVGEFAVRKLLARHPDAEVLPAESFVDAVLAAVGYDPFDRGLRIINGHELPHPLALDAPTIIGHLDSPEVLADVSASLSRVLPEGAEVTVLANLGADDEQVVTVPVDAVPADLAGFRTSMFVDTDPAGLVGLVGVSRRLRAECPWDRSQTHHSLLRHLLEETYE